MNINIISEHERAGVGAGGGGGSTSVIETVILVSQELRYIIQNRKQTPASSYLIHRSAERERERERQHFTIHCDINPPVEGRGQGAGVVAGHWT